jgi:glycosyltransferase involved in cell wall biosynthesis
VKIAYFSPLPPIHTGIADYSDALIGQLSSLVCLDLWTDTGPPPEISTSGRAINYQHDPGALAELPNYDAVIYHLGNSSHHRNIYETFLQHPGFVVLHDFVLHNFLAGYCLEFLKSPTRYVEEMEYNYGSPGKLLAQRILAGDCLPIWETEPLLYPLNKRILDRAAGVIVHSDFIRGLIHNTHPFLPVAKINHFSQPLSQTESIEQLRKKYDVPADKTVIASFGLATKAKRIPSVLAALAQLDPDKFVYLIVGEVTAEVKALIEKTGLRNVVRSTGYVDRETFENYSRLSDICVNLRYPTYGETSGAVCRLLGAGKACIVSDVGWFSEIPSNCAAKIPVDQHEVGMLTSYLTRLIDDQPLRDAMGENASRYVREHHHIEDAAQQYIEFIEEVKAESAGQKLRAEFIESVAQACARVGITEDDNGLLDETARRIAKLL